MNPLTGSLGLFDLLVITIYFLSMLAIGWWYSERQTSTTEFFVAGRGVGSLMAGVSIIATLLSTISYLSTPGEIIRNGLGYLLTTLASPLAFVVVGYLVIPRIMKHDVVTVYELLQGRFGYHVRQTTASFWLLTTLLWMGFIVYTCSLAVAAIIGVSVYPLMCVIGVVTTLYTLTGGIRAVIITDFVQAIVLYLGGAAVILLVMFALPGFSWWPEWSSLSSDLQWPQIKVFSLDPSDRLTIVSGLFHGFIFWVMSATSNQVTIQRFLTTRDAHAARGSFLVTLVASFIIDILLVLVGIALLGYYRSFPTQLPEVGRSIVEQADRLFPHFVGTGMPSGLKGLMVAALLAAAMSSLSSGINSCASVLMTDFAGVFARGCKDDPNRAVRRARVLSLAVGVIATVLAFYTMLLPGRNILDQAMRVSYFLIVPVFVVFVLLFFVPFARASAAWAAIATGFTSGVLFTFWKQIVGPFVATGEFSVFLITPASIALSITTAVFVSLMTRRQPSARLG
jgi:SSS family solute:Na+ symporter